MLAREMNSQACSYHQSIIYKEQKWADTPLSIGDSRAMKVRYYCTCSLIVIVHLYKSAGPVSLSFIIECGAGVSASAYKNIHT